MGLINSEKLNNDDALTKKQVGLNGGGKLNGNAFTRKQVGLNGGGKFNGDNSLTNRMIKLRSKSKGKIRDKIKSKIRG